MRMMTVRNIVTGKIVAHRAAIADNFLRRLQGLLGRDKLLPGQGLLLSPCNSVHTCGMRYRLDIVFLSNELRIIKTVENLSPWRAAYCSNAAMVLELPAGMTAASGCICGHSLQFLFATEFGETEER